MDDATVLSVFAGEMAEGWLGGVDRLIDRLQRLDLEARREAVLRHFQLDRLYPREASPERAESLLRVLRANVLAGVRYAPTGRYPGRVTVFRASERGWSDPTLGWKRLVADEGATGHVLPGNHATILAAPGVHRMAEILSAAMRIGWEVGR